MAYSELIKNFSKIRDYMREFYIYGFKTREEFNKKSSRSYDNEHRRIQSYLKEYMSFSQNINGKNVFICVDTRSITNNPLYKALKSKSFTNKDITLHFIIFDILNKEETYFTLNEIIGKIYNEYLCNFKEPLIFDESTIRKKLKEYIQLELIICKKQGKQVLYSRNKMFDYSSFYDAISFFSESGINGIIGSYLMDRVQTKNDIFLFKHHYIAQALESEILYNLFDAISQKKVVYITSFGRRSKSENLHKVVPLKIFISSQSGRKYLIGYNLKFKYLMTYRLDYIIDIEIKDEYKNFDKLREKLNDIQKNMWGINLYNVNSNLEHIEFTIHIENYEQHIYKRLEREKRCGRVEKIDDNTYKFTADIYDSTEIIPWVRTFISRIVQLNFSNRTVENLIKQDIEQMYCLYGIIGDEKDVI